MDAGTDRVGALARRYTAAWRAAKPAVRAWEKLADRLAEPAVADALARHLRARVGILALDLAVSFEDPWAERPWPVDLRGALADPTLALQGADLPLAVRVHGAVLDAAFRVLEREWAHQSAAPLAALALDVLLAGLGEVAEPVPPALAELATAGKSLTRPAVSMRARFPLPPAPLAALDRGTPADRYIEAREDELRAWRAWRDMLRAGRAPALAPGIRGPAAIERLTELQRHVIGLYADGKSTAAIAAAVGISVGAVQGVRQRARANIAFAAPDALVWEVAGLDDPAWARVQELLEGVTPERGRSDVPTHRGGGPRPVANRRIVAALLLACRTGLDWDGLAHLSPALPPCSRRTAERRLRAWQSDRSWTLLRDRLTPLLRGGAPLDWSRARPKVLGVQANTPNLREIHRLQRLLRAVERLFPDDQDA